MKTNKFECTIGITPGCFHNNENKNIDFNSILNDILLEIENNTGIYISMNIYKTKTMYKKEDGCPRGGENTYTITSIRNPEFIMNKFLWKDQCELIVKRLKEKLNQSTIMYEFYDIEMHCIKD